MRNLIFFTASNNPFSPQQIPAGFGNIPELRFLGLNNANLIGPVPNALSNLREIRSIDFSDNDLTGDISFLRNYNFLQSIALDNNRLSGDIPAEFWQKTSLQIANLENNQLTGQIPPSIGTMTELISKLDMYIVFFV
jgi:Leucine-rich repeat (LRR) protein